MGIDPRPTQSAPDDDPYLWLEDVAGDAACAWADKQSDKTLKELAGPELCRDARVLLDIFDCPDRIPFVARKGGLLYNFWREAGHPRGLWRRTTMASYRLDNPDWEILLDLDALASQEGEDWVWKGAVANAPKHVRALVRLSRGGADASVLREFDLRTRRFVTDGFELPESKSYASWLDDDNLLLSSALGDDNVTSSGYPRTVRLWPRGRDPLGAPVLFETTPDRISCGASFNREIDRIIFHEQIDFFNAWHWIGDRTGPKIKIDAPSNAWKTWFGGNLAVRPRTEWAVGSRSYEPDSVLGIKWDAFLAGDRDFRVLFTPGRRRALQRFFWSAGDLIISVLDDLRPVHLRVLPAEDWRIEEIVGLPSIGIVSLSRLDTDPLESNGELLAFSQSPISPPVMSLMSPGVEAPIVLRKTPEMFDPGSAKVTHHEAMASDGERIPYVQVGPKDQPGNAPVYMTAYGGFRSSMLPAYSATTGKLWIERGGTSVVACIRGGGEFGTWWHDAGRREGKIRSHNDFAAVASDLVRRGITCPKRIAAEGGSNGGLLIANMLTRHSEKFGALFCTIPLVDMRRYTKLLAGASWITEYGDPDCQEDWAFLKQISAYHLAKAGSSYPPILIATTRRDDRVHPGHARKFAAKLQALGHAVQFYELAAGGHGYGKDNTQAAHFAALGHTFLAKAIGWAQGSEN